MNPWFPIGYRRTKGWLIGMESTFQGPQPNLFLQAGSSMRSYQVVPVIIQSAIENLQGCNPCRATYSCFSSWKSLSLYPGWICHFHLGLLPCPPSVHLNNLPAGDCCEVRPEAISPPVWKCPCSRQGVGTRWSLRSRPTQPILFYDSRTLWFYSSMMQWTPSPTNQKQTWQQLGPTSRNFYLKNQIQIE